MSYLNFRKNYKNSIQLNENQFKMICKFQVDTKDQNGLNMIRTHLTEKTQPIKLAPPPPPKPIIIKRIPIIKKRKWLIRFPKINNQTNMGCVINELKINPLFLMQQQRCEVC